MEARATWPGLLFIASAFCFATLFYGGDSQIYQLAIALLLITGGLFWAMPVLGGHRFYWSQVHTVLLFYALFLVIHLYVSVFPEQSLMTLWQFMTLPVVFILCSSLHDTRWQSLIGYLCLPAAVSLAWGYTEFLLGEGRASGPLLDPNSWASTLNLFYFLLLSVFLGLRNRYSILVFCFLILLPAGTFVSYSRVGTLTLVTGLVFVSIFVFMVPRLRRKMILVLLAALIAFGGVNGIRSIEEATRHDEGYTLSVESAGWSKRLAQWQAGILQFKDYPVTGSGLGTFKVLYPNYRNAGDMDTAGNYLHNDYLQILAEGGPAFLLFVLALALYLMVELVVAIRRFFSRQGFAHLEIMILVTAIGTVLVHALMNFTLYNFANQLLIGVCLARLLFLRGQVKRRSIKVVQPNFVKVMLVIVGLYVAVINAADHVSRELALRQGLFSVEPANAEETLKAYELSRVLSALRPGVSTNHFVMATFYRVSFDQQPPEQTEAKRSLAIVTAAEYERGLELNPWHLKVRQYYADFLLAQPWLIHEGFATTSPDQLMRNAVRFGRVYVHSYLLLADHLSRQGNSEEAYKLLAGPALEWANLRYPDHQQYRLELFKRVLAEARARQDAGALNRLLAVMEKRSVVET